MKTQSIYTVDISDLLGTQILCFSNQEAACKFAQHYNSKLDHSEWVAALEVCVFEDFSVQNGEYIFKRQEVQQ